jgi:hypothetical protein
VGDDCKGSGVIMALPVLAYTTQASVVTASSQTTSITVPAVSKGILLVSVHTFDNLSTSDPAVTGVTYNGSAMTLLSVTGSGTPVGRTAIYYTKSPAATTANVVASFTGTVDQSAIIAAVFSGVDQTNTFSGTAQTGNGTGATTSSLTHTTADKNCVVFTSISANQSSSSLFSTVPTSSTSIYTPGSVDSSRAAHYRNAVTAGTYQMDYAWTNSAGRAQITIGLRGAENATGNFFAFL